MLTVGSLFAGIGGFDLGLERAGFEIAWQVEIDPYCQRVLAKHWPHVTRYGDITTIDWGAVEPVDLICGGFPCQPFSLAGQRRGTADDRYLWPEMRLAINQLQPTWVIAENVPGLVGSALDTVLTDLETTGYEVGTLAIPACAVGAPHIRQRIWILAYAQSKQAGIAGQSRINTSLGRLPIAYTEGIGRQQGRQERGGSGEGEGQTEEWTGFTNGARWPSPPDIRGMDARVSKRMDRVRGLGNAIVPQIAEWLGRLILAADPDAQMGER